MLKCNICILNTRSVKPYTYIVNVMGYIDLIPFLMTFIFKENVKQISKKKGFPNEGFGSHYRRIVMRVSLICIYLTFTQKIVSQISVNQIDLCMLL